jgi:hypothetical protein
MRYLYMDENTDLAKQYQDILDQYSKELAAKPSEDSVISEPEIPSTIPLTEVPPPPPPVIPEPKPPIPPTPPSASPIIPPVSKPTVSKPKGNNFFKFLFFFSLLIFLGVCGAILFTMISANQNGAKTPSPTPTSQNPSPTVSPGVCRVNEQTYQVGQSFWAADGCNTCTCNADLTIACTQKACEATPSVKLTPTQSATPTQTLKSQIENWSSYTQSSTKLSWDKCDGEPSVSSNLKELISTYPAYIKEINGLKLAYTSKLDFTAQDVAKFTLCQAGGFYPINTFNDKILWTQACSTGVAQDNPKCEDTLTQIEKLYGYKK